MDKNQLIADLIQFLQEDSACQQCLSCLDKKAEIAIEVAGSVNVKVVYDGKKVSAEEAKAFAPDFVFSASPEAIAILISEKNLSPAQLGIKLCKEVMSREIKVSMPSNIFQITRKGYFKIVAMGGMDFLNELKEHNMASVPKIIAALKKLRK